MILDIHHTTRYQYDRPVFIEPLTIRLRPRTDGRQWVKSFSMSIDPEPTGRTDVIDAAGNDATLLWFNDKHERLILTTESQVHNTEHDVFNYIVTYPPAQSLPASYAEADRNVLAPYLVRTAPTEAVDRWAQDMAKESGPQTTDFLFRMTTHLGGDFDSTIRLEGDAWSPQRTLDERGGACRDLTVLFVDACRSLGLAARFVSGYQYIAEPDDPDADEQLHAWIEVYLPGAGWRGYDPTLGLVVGSTHVALATGPEPADAAPTTGSFRGNDAAGRLETSLKVRAIE